ncbi:MAG: aminotransferase class V-fold PLP-dependent enzyme [Actinobacteria bacterium]|nr:aminotransferase class V-fold PLP-dependent enzyme [Actinomycetota bacterium]
MSSSTSAHTHNFDTLSSHPIHPAAKKALGSLPDYAFVDPTKLYHDSRSARLLLDSARASIAARLKVNPDEVSFIPSGNAGIDLTISGLLKALDNKTVVYSAVEQKAIIERLKDFSTFEIPVDKFARVNESQFIDSLTTNKPGLAVLQFTNHEVGTQQPINPIYKKCQELNIPLFVDATMTAGLVNLGSDWDVLLLKPATWGAPIGIDILVVKRNVRFKSILLDDGRENHKFSNNISIPHAVAIGASLEEITLNRSEIAKSLGTLINDLRQLLASNLDITLLGDPVARLPHVLAAVIKNIDGEALVSGLSKRGFAISSGSSCTPDQVKPSHVLAAMGFDNQINIRISLPFDTKDADILDFIKALNETMKELKESAGI